LALVTLLVLSAPLWAAEAPKAKPNFLFIFCDDHSFQTLSAYGHGLNKTPNIDRIAAAGMRFNKCYVTNSICGPSRAVVITGKYSHMNGFYTNTGDVFDGKQQTMPKLLQAAGYATAMIGKWHLESDPTGFDYWKVLPGQGQYYNPAFIENGKRIQQTGYATDIIGDDALDWLQNKRDKSKPFYLQFWHKAPHREWEPAIRHLNLYKDITVPEPTTLFDDYSGRGRAAHEQDMTIAKTMTRKDLKLEFPKNLNDEQLKAWHAAYDAENEAFEKANLQGDAAVRWKYQRYMKDYMRCIAAVDENVGRVLDYLEKSGLAKNTIVIYSSDQGFYNGEHGWFDKRWMYEESLRTPLLVSVPGASGSVNDKDIVSNVDFAPTILDLAGLPVPSDMQGRSFAPILKGQTPADWRKSFYYHYYEFPGPHMVQRHDGVTDGRYKLIHFYDINEWEMYDLKTDPYELKSVYNDPSYAAERQRLEAELVKLKTELKVPDPDPAYTRMTGPEKRKLHGLPPNPGNGKGKKQQPQAEQK
jgi:arylsulfatase A-like enzyme